MTLREFIDVASSNIVVLDTNENLVYEEVPIHEADVEYSEVIEFWAVDGHIEVLTNYHPETREEDDRYNTRDINFL